MSSGNVRLVLRRALRPVFLGLHGSYVWQKKFFLGALNLAPGDMLIDLGGGSGVWTQELAPLVKRVILIDREAPGYEGGLDRAKRLYVGRLKNCYIVRGDACHIPLRAASADKILCSEVLEHLPDPYSAFMEMARVVRPGGKVAITTPCSAFIDQYRFPITQWARRVLPSWLHRTDLVRYEFEEWERRAGHIHRGFTLSALVGLAAEAGLRLTNSAHLHGRLGALYYELMEGLPWLAVPALPFSRLLYAMEGRQGGIGLNVLCAFQKQ